MVEQHVDPAEELPRSSDSPGGEKPEHGGFPTFGPDVPDQKCRRHDTESMRTGHIHAEHSLNIFRSSK